MVLLNSSSCNFDWQPTNFQFINLNEKKGSFYESFGANGLLVMFICNHCPYVRSIESKIASETKKLKDLKVNSIAFMSNDQNSYEEDHNKFLLEQISRAKFEFEYIVDTSQSIAKTFEAQCTPEFFYFNKDKRCSWHVHRLKDEVFYLQSGKMLVKYSEKDDLENAQELILNQGDNFHVYRGLRHQMIALEDSELFEFSTQHFDSDSYRLVKGD